MSDSVFVIDDLFEMVLRTAREHQLEMTERALGLMKYYHAGQFRKGKDPQPYIVHPLTLARHAIAMSLIDDTLLTVCLLHDVVEDCNVTSNELEVSQDVRDAVDLLTFEKLPGESKHDAKQRYFLALRANETASIVKLLDRCHNVSQMASGFSKEKLAEYIVETEEMVLPLLHFTKEHSPQYANVCWIIEYHVCSLFETIRSL